MKESVGNAFLFNIIIFFVIIFMALFASALVYSKAYRFKNRIVNIIEENEVKNYTTEQMMSEIETGLAEFGYRRKTANDKCPSDDDIKKKLSSKEKVFQTYHSSQYRVCIYKIENSTKDIHYYKVITYMYLDIPIIGDNMQFPVNGETRTFRSDITVY